MQPIEGIYISEIYSTLLQKNTLQLNKFLSQLDKEDWECLFEGNDEDVIQEILDEYKNGTHIEYFIKNFPNIFICKVYKAKFHSFKQNDLGVSYETDYDDLYLFYKFSNDLNSLIETINKEATDIMYQEFNREKREKP